MVILYHFGGAICAQKVRLALAEKAVEWEPRECSGATLRDPEYLKLNPSGVVPTLVHNGRAFTESRIISEYVNESFHGPALMPADTAVRHRARGWSKQVDDSLHLNIFVLTFAAIARDAFLAMPPEVRATAMPGLLDPVKRRISNDLLSDGLDSPWIAMALNRFERLVHDMEMQLAGSRFLAGDVYSLADADLTAYVNRLHDLGLGEMMTAMPALNRWWDDMRLRPSYEAAIVAWRTPQEAESYEKGREQYMRAARANLALHAGLAAPDPHHAKRP